MLFCWYSHSVLLVLKHCTAGLYQLLMTVAALVLLPLCLLRSFAMLAYTRFHVTLPVT